MLNFYSDNNYLSIQLFFVRDGLLSGRHKEIIQTVADDGESVLEYIIKFYEKSGLLPHELYVPEGINNALLSEYLK